MKLPDLLLPFVFVVLSAIGCGGKTKLETISSGRLKFEKELGYGSVGTHGSQGWYVNNQYFRVNNETWSPPDIKLDDIANCEAPPNERVEGLKCYSFKDGKEAVFLLRINDNKTEWITITDQQYAGGKNLGEWTGEGRWLIFREYFFNVETSERRVIKGMPEDPADHFLMCSPDLKTIVLEESTFDDGFDLPADANREKELTKRYDAFYKHIDQGVAAFWLIDPDTGSHTVLELKKDKYEWLTWNQEKFPSKRDWHDYFQKQFVWEKDSSGKYKLVHPT